MSRVRILRFLTGQGHILNFVPGTLSLHFVVNEACLEFYGVHTDKLIPLFHMRD